MNESVSGTLSVAELLTSEIIRTSLDERNTNPEQGKFRLTHEPVAPSICSACGTRRTPLVDFSLSIDYYGAVHFCGDCCREMIALFDYETGVKYRNLERLASEIKDHNDELLEKLEATENALRALRFLDGVVVSDAVTDEVASEELPDSDERVETTSEQRKTTQSKFA